MAFIIGTCQIELHLPGCQSLKDKRRILRSLIERLQNRFNASVAEIEHQDLWQRARVGLAVVSTSQPLIDRTLTQIVAHVENHPGVDLLDYYTEVL